MRKEDLLTALVMFSPALVFIVFLLLKVTEVIYWSWWLVTSPLWGMLGIILILALCYYIAFNIQRRRIHRK